MIKAIPPVLLTIARAFGNRRHDSLLIGLRKISE